MKENKKQFMYLSSDQEFMCRWMELLYPQISSKRLSDILIPGTHNSNTYTVKGLLKPFARNQKFDIYTQLSLGIRFLDLRYGIRNQVFIDQHGIVEGSDFMSHLDQIVQFLAEHRKEFILIKVQAEEELDKTQQRVFVSQVFDKIGEFMITSADDWFQLQNTTIAEIFEHSKRIFLVFDNHYTQFEGCQHFGFFPRKDTYHSKWHNSNDTSYIFESLELDYEEMRNTDYGRLYGGQFVLTPQGIWDTTKKILAGKIPTISNLHDRLQIKSYQFLFNNYDKSWNILLFD